MPATKLSKMISNSKWLLFVINWILTISIVNHDKKRYGLIYSKNPFKYVN